MTLRYRFLLSTAALLALSACSDSDSSGQPGDELVYPTCDETRTPLALDSETPLGVDAGEVFALAIGTHEATLRYASSQTTALAVKIEGEPREIELVERRQAPTPPGKEVATIGIECHDSVEAKLDLHFETEDGAFREHFDGVRFVRTVRPAIAGLEASFRVDLDALEGSYTPNELSPSEYDRIVQGSISMSFQEGGGFEGRIGYVAEKRSGEGPDASVSARSVTVATWESAPSH